MSWLSHIVQCRCRCYCWQVWVSLVWWGQVQEADKVAGIAVHCTVDGLDWTANQQWRVISRHRRSVAADSDICWLTYVLVVSPSVQRLLNKNLLRLLQQFLQARCWFCHSTKIWHKNAINIAIFIVFLCQIYKLHCNGLMRVLYVGSVSYVIIAVYCYAFFAKNVRELFLTFEVYAAYSAVIVS